MRTFNPNPVTRLLEQIKPGRVFVTAASFLYMTAKKGIANLSEISYYEILANEHHHKSP